MGVGEVRGVESELGGGGGGRGKGLPEDKSSERDHESLQGQVL